MDAQRSATLALQSSKTGVAADAPLLDVKATSLLNVHYAYDSAHASLS